MLSRQDGLLPRLIIYHGQPALKVRPSPNDAFSRIRPMPLPKGTRLSLRNTLLPRGIIKRNSCTRPYRSAFRTTLIGELAGSSAVRYSVPTKKGAPGMDGDNFALRRGGEDRGLENMSGTLRSVQFPRRTGSCREINRLYHESSSSFVLFQMLHVHLYMLYLTLQGTAKQPQDPNDHKTVIRMAANQTRVNGNGFKTHFTLLL